jgi:CDGSH iron-sulfur domain-containing protein 3
LKEARFMAEPVVAQKGPFPVDVVAGKTYWWCACGRSKKQPFCDGSHKDTGIEPRPWTAETSGQAWFCGCKASATKPLCDGTHNRL